MVKTLTNIGNSKAVIIPSVLVKRYNLKKITIEATEAGILIRPVEPKTSFLKKIARARKNKAIIYRQMEKEATDSGTIAFYNNTDNTFENVDTDIKEL